MENNRFKPRKLRQRNISSDLAFVNLRDLPSDNMYIRFIEECRQKREFEKNKEQKTFLSDTTIETEDIFVLERGEIHHIIPLANHGGPDTEENCILLTREEHIIAHRIIAEVTGNPSDLRAYDFMLRV